MTSPVMTVNLMILSVAGPFLFAMILLYALGSGSRSINDLDRCADADVRLVGVLRYIYDDYAYSFRYVGTAIIVGDNIAITVPQTLMMRDYAMYPRTFQEIFYLSSGSKFWYNEKSIQKVKDVTFFPYNYDKFSWTTGEVIVFHTDEGFPKCTSASKVLTVSTAPVPDLEESESSFSVWGWKEDLTRAHERYTSEDFQVKSPTTIPGGAIFTDDKFWGLMRTSVGQLEDFFERQEFEKKIKNQSDESERRRMRLYVNFGEIFEQFKQTYPEARIKRDREHTGGPVDCGTVCGNETTSVTKAVSSTMNKDSVVSGATENTKAGGATKEGG